MTQKTSMPAKEQVLADRKWHFIDADGQVLGRLASRAASLLMGKGKPFLCAHLDCGDFVVVTNASRIKLTGNKLEQKEYFRHSGYASGAKIIPVKNQLSRDSRKVIVLAVKRMLPKNRLASRQITRLKVYPGEAHPHRDKEKPSGQHKQAE